MTRELQVHKYSVASSLPSRPLSAGSALLCLSLASILLLLFLRPHNSAQWPRHLSLLSLCLKVQARRSTNPLGSRPLAPGDIAWLTHPALVHNDPMGRDPIVQMWRQ